MMLSGTSVTPPARPTYVSVREPSAFAEVTLEEREALQSKPPFSGLAVTSCFTTSVTPNSRVSQKLNHSLAIDPRMKTLLHQLR
jgi:hypothetical protein